MANLTHPHYLEQLANLEQDQTPQRHRKCGNHTESRLEESSPPPQIKVLSEHLLNLNRNPIRSRANIDIDREHDHKPLSNSDPVRFHFRFKNSINSSHSSYLLVKWLIPNSIMKFVQMMKLHLHHYWLLLVLLLCHCKSSYATFTSYQLSTQDPNLPQIHSILKLDPASKTPATQNRLHKLISSHVYTILQQIDKLQDLNYGELCDSVTEEKERHDLTNLIAQVTQTPSEELLSKIHKKEETILEGKTLLCNYTRGLACDGDAMKCICYDGSRHDDIEYEPVRENGACRLDEMSRCYSPSYSVSRGANVIPCITGARCVGDVTGRRCVFPVMTENCHCQKPCPDGTFSNLMDELKKCIAKLDEISVLGFNDSCTPPDQAERDEVVRILETSGSDSAGPIIRGIKRLLASERFLCSPQEQLVCHPESQVCVCGPEKDGILYDRVNGTCQWAKGSRCFPEDIYANVTGSNGTCIEGTQCFLEGELVPCDPNYEEPLCFCQDPEDLEGSGVIIGVMVLFVVVLVGGVLGFLVHSGKITCPPGSSPANV